jgi:hypothetical protein
LESVRGANLVFKAAALSAEEHALVSVFYLEHIKNSTINKEIIHSESIL